jgi:hypothetical protein
MSELHVRETPACPAGRAPGSASAVLPTGHRPAEPGRGVTDDRLAVAEAGDPEVERGQAVELPIGAGGVLRGAL